MKIAVFSKNLKNFFNQSIFDLFETFKKKNIIILVYQPFFEFVKILKVDGFFNSYEDLPEDIDLFITIGGDGTLLESVSFVRNRNIPIIGINTGRMGFLANLSIDELQIAFDFIFKERYKIEERSLLKLITPNNLFGDHNFALNECTVQKKDTGSMIRIHTYINDEYLNTYWADGLIISTPTGSTAYSLSVGGPIVVPNSDNFVITPIAPHNLTVRPIVVSDSNEIKLNVEGRNPNFLVSLDYRNEVFDSSIDLVVKRADFKIKLLKLENHSFYSTLRNRLMWGIDKRN
jgi:NAD+ kinase